jgi:hypothetical protein
MEAIRNFFRLFGAAPMAVVVAQDPNFLFERAVEPARPRVRALVRRNAMRRLYVIDHPHLYRPPTPPLGHQMNHARVHAIF